MKTLLHLTARTRRRSKPLLNREACADLWGRLTTRFETLACALLPTHVHLLAETMLDEGLRSFGKILSAFQARWPHLGFEWDPLPRPEKVQYDRRHIARTIRYIHLNPCRDGLCRDPLEWEWSTHRDWIGAIARPMVDMRRWGADLKWNGARGILDLHSYVSKDPTVRLEGTPAPVMRELDALSADVSLAQIGQAVPLVLRSAASGPLEFGPTERRLAVAAAELWTGYRSGAVGAWLGCDSSNVRRILRENPPKAGEPELRALALTLSDARLLNGVWRP